MFNMQLPKEAKRVASTKKGALTAVKAAIVTDEKAFKAAQAEKHTVLVIQHGGLDAGEASYGKDGKGTRWGFTFEARILDADGNEVIIFGKGPYVNDTGVSEGS